MAARVILLLAGALAASTPGAAGAHRRSLVRVQAHLEDKRVELVLAGSLADLAPTLEVAEGVRPLPVLYRAKRGVVIDNIARYLTLEAGPGVLCKPGRRALRIRQEREVIVELEFLCPRVAEEVTLRYDLFLDHGPGNRALLRIRSGATRVISPGRRIVRLRQRVSPWVFAAEFLLLGVEHIFTGYDHLLFLLALLLMSGLTGAQAEGGRRGLLQLLAIVSSFTVAHSVTLIAAALEWVALPPKIVEAGIALTIVIVSLENILRRQARHRWLVTFAFGLVHGFGFAHVLREIGLPKSGLILSLLSFNVGVELGQVAVVALLYPVIVILARGRLGVGAALLNLLLLGLLLGLLTLSGVAMTWQPIAAAAALALFMAGLRRFGYRRLVLQGGSAVIALFGLLWLVQRALGLSLLGGALG